jgi:hypothetical protein
MDGFVNRLHAFRFLHACDPSYGALTFTPVGLFPLNTSAFCWTCDWAPHSPPYPLNAQQLGKNGRPTLKKNRLSKSYIPEPCVGGQTNVRAVLGRQNHSCDWRARQTAASNIRTD